MSVPTTSMGPAGTSTRGRWSLVAAGLVVAASLGSPTSAPSGADPGSSALRPRAVAAGLRFGATLEPAQIADPDYAATLAAEFSSVTAENAMKWYAIEPERDAVDFSGADAVLGFAEANGMEVRGHALIWAQDRFTPAWVLAITDPDELRAEVEDHVRSVLERYRGRIHRWDVVNEPLDTMGGARSDNVFERVLGPDWIGDVFRLAHEVDPDAELWLNEYGPDWNPTKHRALVALLRQLRSEGVPVHGVGIQTHRLTAGPPDRRTFEGILRDYAALGLRVALTEVDVPTTPDAPGEVLLQAATFETLVVSCLAVPACEEVTTWGVTDGDTWLDSLGLLPVPTRPLLFDERFRPKPAHRAVARVLDGGRAAARASSPWASPPMAPPTTTEIEPPSGPAAGVAPPASPVSADPTYTG